MLGYGIMVLDENGRIIDEGGIEIDENVHHEKDVEGQVERVDKSEVTVGSDED
jgi:hypothetical protein